MNTTNVAVCFSANEAYLQHTTVAMLSFAKHNKRGYDLFLLTDGISAAAENRLRKNVHRQNPSVNLTILKVDDTQLKQLKGQIERLPVQAYYRFLIPFLLSSYDVGIYMDSDIVCLKPFRLDEIPINENGISAIKDFFSDNLSKERGWTNCFNSGVLVYNMKLWREQNILTGLLRTTPKKMTFADQELLNEYFQDDWHELREEFNYPAPKIGFKHLFRKATAPIIVHYIGAQKPWDYFRLSSIFYWKYLLQSDYKSQFWRIVVTFYNSGAFYMQKYFRSVSLKTKSLSE